MIGRIIGEGKKTRYLIDGKEVSKRKFKKAFPDKPIKHGDKFLMEGLWQKPVVSVTAGCHPKRIKEFEAYMAKRGMPTDFTTHRGRPIFTSRAHQIEGLKALELHNKDEVRG